MLSESMNAEDAYDFRLMEQTPVKALRLAVSNAHRGRLFRPSPAVNNLPLFESYRPWRDYSSTHVRSDEVHLQQPKAAHIEGYDYHLKQDCLSQFDEILIEFEPLFDLENNKSTSSREKSLGHLVLSTLPKSLELSASSFATKRIMNALLLNHPLQPLTGTKWQREATYIYRRPWALIVTVNVMLLATMTLKPNLVENFTYHQASTATGANFLFATLGKQEHVINLLFRLACALSPRAPLGIRRQVARVFMHGGLHAGCGISAFLWYVAFTVLLVKQFEGTYAESAALGPTTAIILAVLLLVLVTSLPGIRLRWPRQWELSHRYGGWTAISFSWAQTSIMVIAEARRANRMAAYELMRTPTFYVLSVISICIVYPWVRLRRRKFETEVLSGNAVRLWFKHRRLPTCRDYKLSHAPLIENHNTATIPNSDNQHGYSIVISGANKWPRTFVQTPSEHIWTRGPPVTNRLRISTLFNPIVIVATGSGIAPCLSLLQVHHDRPIRIIWSARSAESTYGREIMDSILKADPEALIVDTATTEQPDLVALAYALYREISAEAIVFSCDAHVKRGLMYEMEGRGIAVFGIVENTI